MGNSPTGYAGTYVSHYGFYWSAYKQAQDNSHSKFRAADGTGFTIRGFYASDGFNSPQRRPYAHWAASYPDTNEGWKCGAHQYDGRYQSLGAVNASNVPRVKSTDDTLNAWGLTNRYCGWSYGFICLAKSEPPAWRCMCCAAPAAALGEPAQGTPRRGLAPLCPPAGACKRGKPPAAQLPL